MSHGNGVLDGVVGRVFFYSARVAIGFAGLAEVDRCAGFADPPEAVEALEGFILTFGSDALAASDGRRLISARGADEIDALTHGILVHVN